MNSRFPSALVCVQALLIATHAFALPLGKPQTLNDQNMKVVFEVHAPWNILDGTAQQVSGEITLTTDGKPDSVRADVAVQDIEYKAGLSTAGRLVARWLRSNPPT